MVFMHIENTPKVTASSPFSLFVQPQCKEEQFDRNVQVINLLTSFIGEQLKNSTLKHKLLRAVQMKKPVERENISVALDIDGQQDAAVVCERTHEFDESSQSLLF